MSSSDPSHYAAQFQAQGLLHEAGEDDPGKVYTPHRHGWVKLVTLAGSVRLRLDGGKWLQQTEGDVCEIQSGQVHEAIVGATGWKWVAAWRPEEDSTFSVHH